MSCRTTRRLQVRSNPPLSVTGLGATALTVALGLLACVAAHAQDASFVLAFGGEPGAPLAHAYDYGAPPAGTDTYSMRVPVFDPEVLPILYDSELSIDAKTKIVQRAHAERALKTIAECEAAKKKLDAKIAAVFKIPYTGSDPGWQYASEKGTGVGGTQCHTARHLPYVTLILDLSVPPPTP